MNSKNFVKASSINPAISGLKTGRGKSRKCSRGHLWGKTQHLKGYPVGLSVQLCERKNCKEVKWF